MHTHSYVCLCRLVCVLKRARTGDGGFKLTEHASASACLNYPWIKFIRGVALKVKVGINACFKDDCAQRGLILQPKKINSIGIHLCHLKGTGKRKQLRSRLRQYTSK